MRYDATLHPIDVGFDLRVHGMTAKLSRTVRTVRYQSPDGDDRVARGDLNTILEELRTAGYKIKLAD